MLRLFPLLSLCLAVLLALVAGCDGGDPISEPPPEERPPPGTWQDLGFPLSSDVFFEALDLEGPYLYAAVDERGLWRLNVEEEGAQWQELRLADSTTTHRGGTVYDVEARGKEVLAAYSDHAQVPWESVGIWRSDDSGETWQRSDTGIPDSTYPYGRAFSVSRSPHRPEMAVASYGVIFHSADGGTTWGVVHLRRGTLVHQTASVWHPLRPGEVWDFGASSFGGPLLRRSRDYGQSWQEVPWPESLGGRERLYQEVTAVAFDASEAEVLYLATTKLLGRSTDGGETWAELPLQGNFYDLAAHPSRPGVLYAADWEEGLYRSTDRGETWEALAAPEGDIGIYYTLLYDEPAASLLVGTTQSLYRYYTE